MSTIHNNQDPKFYSRQYYLQSCAGSEVFRPGADSNHPLYTYIFDSMNVKVAEKKILDLGCGRGELCIASMRRGAIKVVGLDFSLDAIEIARDHLAKCEDLKNNDVSFIQGNALELNLNEKFDIIFLTDIIEHLYDNQLEVLFKKVQLHLAHDGLVIIHTMPTKEFILIGQYFKFITFLFKRQKHHFLTFKGQAAETHVNLHHREQLERSLKDFNFKIWYDFADRSLIKSIISRTPLVRILSGNLWAIAKHKQ